MRVKDVIRLSVLLMLIGRAMWSGPVPLGFVEGHVKIFPLSDVNLSDDTGAPDSGSAQPYFEYRLVVRSREEKKFASVDQLVAQMAADVASARAVFDELRLTGEASVSG